MTVTDFKTRITTSTYSTPPQGPAAVDEANNMQANAKGAIMGFDVDTQTYTLGLTLSWYVYLLLHLLLHISSLIDCPVSRMLTYLSPL